MLDILATKTLDVKRPPAMSGGKRGQPVAVDGLAALPCLPLAPVQPARAQELIARWKFPAAVVLLETWVAGKHDIRHGDVVVLDGGEYPVRAVAAWTAFGGAGEHTHLVVEDVRP